MKITSVDILDLHLENQPTWHPVIVRIHTDEGITGLGEVGLAYGTGHSAGAAMARDLAQEFFIGQDPFRSEALWDTMWRKTFWAQGGGAVVFGGISGLDTALWDIKGRALGVPCYQLLGGKTNDNLRTYASQIQFGWGLGRAALTTPEEYASAALDAVADGYDCVKIDPVMFAPDGGRNVMDLRGVLSRQRLNMFRDRIKAVREAVGWEVDIILELHSFLGATSAVQLGEVWEEYGCMLYEEPTHYVDPTAHGVVARNVRIPMAAGERIYTRWGYRPYFEGQTISVIQPDLGTVGGLTEGKKVCDYAHTYDIAVQAHVCGSPVATAAALQLEAAIPNFCIHEHHTNALKMHNRHICQQDLQPVDGKFAVPDAPGLGIDLNEDCVKDSPVLVAE